MEAGQFSTLPQNQPPRQQNPRQSVTICTTVTTMETLRTKMRELLITSDFDNSTSTPEFYEVVELSVLANDGTEIAIRAIGIEFLIDYS